MIVLKNIAIGQCCSPSNDIVVLLQVEEIIFLLIVFIFCVNFVFDDESHIAVWETNVLIQVEPTVLICVESVAEVVAELWHVGVTFIHVNDIVAEESNTLFGDIDLLVFGDVGSTIGVPEDFGIEA